MKNSRTLEATVGIFIIMAILSILFLAYKVSQIDSIDEGNSYTLHANFESVSGLKQGAAVMMAGVKIGYIKNISLLRDQYKARVDLVIDNKFDNLPSDTSASVLTSGLLGDKYIGLDPGSFDDYLADNDDIQFTKSSLVLERLIDKFVLNSSKK